MQRSAAEGWKARRMNLECQRNHAVRMTLSAFVSAARPNVS